MIALILFTFTVNLSAQASDRFSVEDWKQSFAAAVSKNNVQKLNQLTDLQKIETQAVPKCVDCENKNKLRQARDLFSKGDYAGAEKLYNQIPKGSDVWLEAVEERGWSHFRRENFEKTLAQTKTLLSPQFVGGVGTEAYFLQSLAQLRICNYEGILTTHQMFKEKHKTRIIEIQNLSNTGVNNALKQIVQKTSKFPLKYEDFGELVTKLPLLFYRDLEVQRHLLNLKISQAALTVLSDTSSSIYKVKFTQLKSDSSAKLQKRIQVLATEENAASAKIVQKLNLIEVEAIQRIHTDMGLKDESYKLSKFKKTNDDQLIFMDDGQPWIDELDKYDVAAKSCVKGIRRKM